MTYDEQKQKSKALELVGIAAKGLGACDPNIKEPAAVEIIRYFAQISAPEEPPAELELITLDLPRRGRAKSTKPGNIRLNLRKLITAAAGGALAVAGAIHPPWMIVLAAIVVWDSVWSCAEVPLSETEAAIVWTMWKNSDDRHTIPREGLLDLVNQHLNRYGRGSIGQEQFQESLRNLERIQCIESSNDSHWWLREWVSVNYR
jgi:hypothetical protein